MDDEATQTPERSQVRSQAENFKKYDLTKKDTAFTKKVVEESARKRIKAKSDPRKPSSQLSDNGLKRGTVPKADYYRSTDNTVSGNIHEGNTEKEGSKKAFKKKVQFKKVGNVSEEQNNKYARRKASLKSEYSYARQRKFFSDAPTYDRPMGSERKIKKDFFSFKRAAALSASQFNKVTSTVNSSFSTEEDDDIQSSSSDKISGTPKEVFKQKNAFLNNKKQRTRAEDKRAEKKAVYKKRTQRRSYGAGTASGRTTPGAKKSGVIRKLMPKTPLGWVLYIVAFFILLFILILVIPLTSSVGVASIGAVGIENITTFSATEEDILGVEADYAAKERRLQNELEAVESTYPGYDTYTYVLDEIGHNPFELASYLTAKYLDFKQSDPQVQSELNFLFEKEYQLTYAEKIGEDGKRELIITLTNTSIGSIAASNLDSDSYAHYKILMEDYGDKRDLFNGNGIELRNSDLTNLDLSDLDYSKEIDAKPIQKKLATYAAKNISTRAATAGWCAAWVSGVYEAAGLGYPGGDAYTFWTRWSGSGSSDMSTVPLGAAVISYPIPGVNAPYGHIGIYIGNGMIASNVGGVKIESIESFNNTFHIAGWVWPYGHPPY